MNGQKEGGGTGRWERRIGRARGSEVKEQKEEREVGQEDGKGG